MDENLPNDVIAFECCLIMIYICYVDDCTLIKRWNIVLFFHHFCTVCRHRHSIYISWSNGTQKVITSLGKSLFFSFWLKPADSSFSCWHFLVSLCYAYTMTKVIITNYLNTYTTCTYVKKDMSVSFWFKPEKIFYYWLSWLHIGLYFHLISSLIKGHFFAIFLHETDAYFFVLQNSFFNIKIYLWLYVFPLKCW